MKFKVLIRKGLDFGFVAEVPSLPGCVSQGDTLDDALSNIREAIELYIVDMADKDIELASENNPELYEIAI